MEALDARAAGRWARAAVRALAQVRGRLDASNVYPVPDGDTGTNLYLTLEAAYAAVAQLSPDVPLAVAADAYALGALRGARGNSGAILAQMIRGWADTTHGRSLVDADTLTEALERADQQAWAAVEAPVEGTILSVSRAAAVAARAARSAGADLLQVADAVAVAARAALLATPDQLLALRRAGVVDAGAEGFVVLVETMADLIGGGSRRRPGHDGGDPGPVTALRDLGGDLEAGGPAYEVMYLLYADDASVRQLRDQLAGLGDSLVVIGGQGLWHVHVHVDDAGAAIEAGLASGRPHKVRVTHFAEQARKALPGARRPGVGLVACAAGPGLAEVFAAVGAVVVMEPGGRRPSPTRLAAAVRESDAESVVILPNDPETLLVARAVAASARQEGLRVSVLPTRAQVQGLAAAAVHDPLRNAEQDVVAMSSAAGGARDGAVTVATRDGITTAGVCHAGDALGVLGGDFAIIGKDVGAVAVEIVERLLSGGGELVTLVTGQGADPGVVTHVRRHLRESRRMVEVSVIDGGQERYPLLVGVE